MGKSLEVMLQMAGQDDAGAKLSCPAPNRG